MNSLLKHVLLIEGDLAHAREIERMLHDQDRFEIKLLHASTHEEALQIISQEKIDVILVDLFDSELSGIQGLGELRVGASQSAIILLTTDNDESLLDVSETYGVVDYLVKGRFDNEALIRSLRYAIENKKLQSDLVSVKSKYYSISKSSPNIEAHQDPVTKLPSRILFHDRLRQAISQARRDQCCVSMFCIGIDLFERVNENLGHQMGDRILQQLSERFMRILYDSDTIVRLAGDEFMILIPRLEAEENMKIILQKIFDVFKSPFIVAGESIYLSCSVGVSSFPTNCDNGDDLLKQANIAMHFAKRRGRNGFRFYTSSMSYQTQHRFHLQNDLRRAIEREEFELFYQPMVNTKNGKITGAEALIRWNHPKRGMVPPDQFIPLAEETGLIGPIGEWVLKKACEQNKHWQAIQLPMLRVAVNISARQFQGGKLVGQVERALQGSRLGPEYLELELTEGVIMRDVEDSIETIKALREIGVRISIDDFGSGHSSLSQLKRIPVDTLKMDRIFIRDVASSAQDAAIVKAIITMAHQMQLKVVAEGVEEEDQLSFLQSNACHLIQGFLLSKPMSVTKFTNFLNDYGDREAFQQFVA